MSSARWGKAHGATEVREQRIQQQPVILFTSRTSKVATSLGAACFTDRHGVPLLQMMRILPLAFILVAACEDSGPSASIDGGSQEFDAMSISDAATTADGPRPDATPENPCVRHSLGLGVRADIAYADGFFAVARFGLGFELKVTQFEENGTQATTVSTPGELFSSPPALAGRESFLIAYQGPPEDGLGLMPLKPGGELGMTTFVPTTGAVQYMLLDASSNTTEFGLVYQDEEGVKFVRAAADGSVVSGPTLLGFPPLTRLRGMSYRDGGWAVVTRLDMAVNLQLLDNNGSIESTHALPDGTVVGGMTSLGAEVSVLGWSPSSLTLYQVNSTFPLGPANYPGEIIADSEGYTASYVDSVLELHVLHATATGTILSDQVLGGQLSVLPVEFPRVAVSPSGTRAAAWVKDLHGETDPELFFGLACDP